VSVGRAWKVVLALVILEGVSCSKPWAEGVLLQGDPSVTHLAVKGPVSVSGGTLLPIAELPIGEYRLTASGPGLPAVRARFANLGNGLVQRSWVGPIALALPPGFVHLERGESRGWVFLNAGIASGVMWVVSEAQVKNAIDNVARATTAYGEAVSENEITIARLSQLSAMREERDYREIRNLWRGYFAYAWLGACVESWLLTPQADITPTSNAGGYTVACPRAGAGSAALRSALVPGAGQRYMGNAGKANLFAAATAGLGAGAIAAHGRFLGAKRDQARARWLYERAGTGQDAAQALRSLEKQSDKRNEMNILQWSLSGATAAIYLWNVVDAFGLGQSARVEGLNLTLGPTSDGLLIGASWSIQ
jgi:hypothetical protein